MYDEKERCIPKKDSCYLSGVTRIVCMSDSHGKHRSISIPKGDVLIHGGDFTSTGEPKTIKDLSAFFLQTKISHGFQEVICIAGNHDLTFHADHYKKVNKRFHGEQPHDTNEARQNLRNCTYLEDNACTISNESIQVYGSPWQPEFFDWAFNLPRGRPLRDVWSKIPGSTDVLITHGPPLGRGDLCRGGNRAGCYDLLQEVQQRIKPRLHIFGHIHEDYGVSTDGVTTFVNASNLNFFYAPHNPCIVIDLPHDTSQKAIIIKPQCNLTFPMFLHWLKEKRCFDFLVSALEGNKNNINNSITGLYNTADSIHLAQVSESCFPQGNALLNEDTYKIIQEFFLCSSETEFEHKAKLELRRALSQLYAESYKY